MNITTCKDMFLPAKTAELTVLFEQKEKLTEAIDKHREGTPEYTTLLEKLEVTSVFLARELILLYEGILVMFRFCDGGEDDTATTEDLQRLATGARETVRTLPYLPETYRLTFLGAMACMDFPKKNELN